MVQWWQIVITVVCILLSGTFSGLTLGLMSLDIIDLRVLSQSGSEKEKSYALRVLPVRRHGNWLLCTLLIGNTVVNAALAIVTADIFGGIAGLLASTTIILYIGEIIPQAVCHRFGLVVGAFSIPLVRLLMYMTAPLSFTTAKALDFFLGGDSPAIRYNRSQLKSLVGMHGRQNSETNLQSSDDPVSQPEPPPPAYRLQPSSSTNHTIIELQEDPDQSPESPSHSNPERSLSSPSSSIPTDSENNPTPPSSTSRFNFFTRFNPFSRSRHSHTSTLSTTRRRERRERPSRSDAAHAPLTIDDMAVLDGAFDFSQKSVGQVMTSLDDVFMLEASLSLNFKILLLIFQSGHSRVPVYADERDNIIGMLFAKDLILLDPEDSVPIRKALSFFRRNVLLVMDHTPLNKMLNIFCQGGAHMAIVRKEQPLETKPLTIGIVTLEDLIEELIGQDIVDETDVYTDNLNKQRVKRFRSIGPEVLKLFDSKHDEDILSEKEVLVVASYLCNNTHEFSEKFIRVEVLRKMLAENPIIECHKDNNIWSQPLDDLCDMNDTGELEDICDAGPTLSRGTGWGGSDHNSTSSNTPEVHGSGANDVNGISDGTMDPADNPGVVVPDVDAPKSNDLADSDLTESDSLDDATVYSRKVPTMNAYLIINGRLQIISGDDCFLSEAGPWTLLGARALTDDLYAPDFTARVMERPTRLLRISRKLYRSMVNASRRNRQDGSGEMVRGKSEARVESQLSSGQLFRGRDSSRNRSSASLAMAAAATAVAVGRPFSDGRKVSEESFDTSVVNRSRSIRDGQSLEWSELEAHVTMMDTFRHDVSGKQAERHIPRNESDDGSDSQGEVELNSDGEVQISTRRSDV